MAPSLEQQIAELEQRMADTPTGDRYFTLSNDRDRLLALLQQRDRPRVSIHHHNMDWDD